MWELARQVSQALGRRIGTGRPTEAYRREVFFLARGESSLAINLSLTYYLPTYLRTEPLPFASLSSAPFTS